MKNIFVGNMSFQTKESDLRALFEPFGQIARIHIVNDRETGRSRGFAFVEMEKDDDAVKAIAGLNGKELDGRALRVNEAAPKAEGGARGGGFRPGGGGDKRGGRPRGGREGFSTEDYRGAARQPKEPRW